MPADHDWIGHQARGECTSARPGTGLSTLLQQPPKLYNDCLLKGMLQASLSSFDWLAQARLCKAVEQEADRHALRRSLTTLEPRSPSASIRAASPGASATPSP